MNHPFFFKSDHLSIRILALFMVFWCLPVVADGQIPIPPEVQAELDSRNINEAELRTRLLARGIDLDTVSPDELPLLRGEIEAVLAEMEAENQGGSPTAITSESRDSLPPAEVQNIPIGTPVPSAPIAPAAPPSEQPIYGHSIFTDGSLQVQSGGEDARPPDSYRLGVGDVVVVNIFGRSQADLQFSIGPDGYIRPPSMPRIFLKGLPQVEAEELLRRRFGQYYIFGPGEFAMTVSASRTITVNIFGEVAASGSYSLSALNTAFNAVVAAGGPTDAGSVRQIRLIRGESVRTIDVYDYLNDPSQAADFSLENNDVIFVPPAEIIASIDGAIRRPLRYELLATESLNKLIDYAGGLESNALDGRARVARTVDGEALTLSVAANDATGFALQNGDEVEILAVIDPVERFVAIDGEVDLPGRYGFRDGLRLSYLIDQGRLRPGSRRDLAFLLRINPDGTRRLIQVDPAAAMANPGGDADVLLMNADRLEVFASRTYIDNSFISVSGSVRNAIDSFPYPSDEAMMLTEAITLAGGLRTDAEPKGFVIRTDLQNRERRSYIEIDLSLAIADPSSPANIVLQPFDQVVVYGRDRFEDQFSVEVNGAVREPGVYTFDPSLGISELLRLAGGFRIDANTDRIEVFRLEYNRNVATRTVRAEISMTTDLELVAPVDFELRPFDQVVVRSVAEFEEIQNVFIGGEVSYPGEYAILRDNERISDVIQRAGGLTKEAFAAGASMIRTANDLGEVVLNLDEVVNNPQVASNVILREGDTINVPKQQELVIILIAGTRAQALLDEDLIEDGKIVVAYQGNHSAGWYINRYAGGFDRDLARRRWTTVRHPNGQVRETAKLLTFNSFPEILPGSTIRVGLKPAKIPRDPDAPRTDWTEIIQATLGGVTTLVTLYLLIDRI